MRRSPELQRIIEDIRETIVEEAEGGLRELVERRYPPAIFFVLKTLGRDRGHRTTVALSGDATSGALRAQIEKFSSRYEAMSNKELSAELDAWRAESRA